MFLRFGLVVGESGLIQAVMIVLAAKLITTLTALSVSGLATNPEWRNHSIRLVFAVADPEQEEKAREQLSKLIEAARVPAALEIVAGEAAIAPMRSCSQEAALVLKGFTPSEEAEDLATLEEIGDLRRVIMVYSAGGHSLSA